MGLDTPAVIALVGFGVMIAISLGITGWFIMQKK